MLLYSSILHDLEQALKWVVCHLCRTSSSIWTKKKFEVKSSRGKKFDFFGDSNLFPVEPFSSKFFYVHIEAVILQKWQTTHFKACSKWLRMAKSNMLIYFKYEQKYLSKVSCSNFLLDPTFAVRFCIQEKVESSINNLKEEFLIRNHCLMVVSNF